jgi:hypothetical protein
MNVQPINLSIDLVQTAVYVALALGGYALRSLNIFGGKTTTPTATTPPAAPAPTSHPVLNQVIAAVESQIQAVLQNAVAGLIQPAPSPSPSPTPATPTTPAKP